MGKETLQSVQEMVAARPGEDTSAFFEQLWQMSQRLRARVEARFSVTRDPCSDAVATYGDPPAETGGSEPPDAPRGPHGEMELLSGDEIDWMVHSRVGNPRFSFTNMHLTLWLGPQTTVPHLGFAFGTLPDFFWLVEYIPRSDLAVDVEALDRYYEPVNDKWMEVREHPKLRPFVSRSLYVRQVMSETSFCYTTERSDEMVAFVENLANEELDRWFGWLDSAEPTPVKEREALAERDLLTRRLIAERDPANPMAVRYFGQEMADRLVRNLWGGDRRSRRAG